MLFTEYLNILHHLQAMKRAFLKLFLTCMIKNSNLVDIFTNLAENQKIVELRGVHGVCFFQVWAQTESLVVLMWYQLND